MQSIEARVEYRNTFHCAYRVATEEGIRAFWAGALPRLTRLMVRNHSLFNDHCYESIDVLTTLQFSGGLVFTMYEKTMELFDVVDPKRVYI